MMLLENPPTRLRRFHQQDLRRFQAYRMDPVVGKFQSWEAMTDTQAIGFIDHMTTCTLFRPDRWTQVAIAHCDDDALIGDMGLHLSGDGKSVEVGMTLALGHQRKGHGHRAFDLAVTLIWDNSSAREIRAYTDQRNTGSLALLRSTAMQHIGTETAADGVIEEVFSLPRPA